MNLLVCIPSSSAFDRVEQVQGNLDPNSNGSFFCIVCMLLVNLNRPTPVDLFGWN